MNPSLKEQIDACLSARLILCLGFRLHIACSCLKVHYCAEAPHGILITLYNHLLRLLDVAADHRNISSGHKTSDRAADIPYHISMGVDHMQCRKLPRQPAYIRAREFCHRWIALRLSLPFHTAAHSEHFIVTLTKLKQTFAG